MASRLEHFDVLRKNGLEVIPLHRHTKNPIYFGWQSSYDPEESRRHFAQDPKANLGLRLGEIIDVEGDSDNANKIIADMIGDCPHPSYFSSKSVHHLFLNPFRNLTRLVFQCIEFRAYRHQSVLPPSTVDGIVYKWTSTNFPVPPLPDRLYKFLEHIRRNQQNDVKRGHVKLPCAVCKKTVYIHKHRLDLELLAFKTSCQRWMCRECREVDLRPLCRKLSKRINR